MGSLASKGLAQAGGDQPRTGRYLMIGVAMEEISRETWVAFEGRLDRAGVPVPDRPEYHKWVRFYFDFCHKYGHSPALSTSLGPFLTKLASKNQSVDQRSQASVAVRLLNLAGPELGPTPPPLRATPVRSAPATLGQTLPRRGVVQN